MSDLSPGNVALIVAGLSTLISASAAAVVKVLAALNRDQKTVAAGQQAVAAAQLAVVETQQTVVKTLDQVHDKVNGAADAAREKLAGLTQEVATLRTLVEVQKAAIDVLTTRAEELLSQIRLLERGRRRRDEETAADVDPGRRGQG